MIKNTSSWPFIAGAGIVDLDNNDQRLQFDIQAMETIGLFTASLATSC